MSSGKLDGKKLAQGLNRQALEAYWMPFTGNRMFKDDPRMIVGAEGCYFTDDKGRQIYDSLSGLWCTPLGHANPDIVRAVREQIGTLDYAPGFQFGQPLAFELANRLTNMTPDGLDYAFFVNSGSDAADTSMKMARAYWRLKGQPSKTKLIGRARGYHGVNFAGTSLGGIGANRKLFGLLADADHLPHTLLKENAYSKGSPQYGGLELADTLEEIVALHDASNIAAVIVEPVAGSGGVIPPPAGYLKRLRELCDKHDILLVFDEVITGFGRTGNAFAAQTFDVRPDIMNLAKALTNGTIPMGVVIADRTIYETFMSSAEFDSQIEFPHGYTYSAHPVACAAGLAALDVYERDDMWQKSAELSKHLERAVHALRDEPYVTDIRNYGLAAAVQLEGIAGEPGKRPLQATIKCWEKELYLRCGGDTLQLAPPFISTPDEIESMCGKIRETLREI